MHLAKPTYAVFLVCNSRVTVHSFWFLCRFGALDTFGVWLEDRNCSELGAAKRDAGRLSGVQAIPTLPHLLRVPDGSTAMPRNYVDAPFSLKLSSARRRLGSAVGRVPGGNLRSASPLTAVTTLPSL